MSSSLLILELCKWKNARHSFGHINKIYQDCHPRNISVGSRQGSYWLIESSRSQSFQEFGVDVIVSRIFAALHVLESCVHFLWRDGGHHCSHLVQRAPTVDTPFLCNILFNLMFDRGPANFDKVAGHRIRFY